MNIYVLTRKGRTGWDEYDSFCVVAPTAQSARKIAMRCAGDYDHCDWTSPRDADIENVGTARDGVKATILVSSFNAG